MNPKRLAEIERIHAAYLSRCCPDPTNVDGYPDHESDACFNEMHPERGEEHMLGFALGAALAGIRTLTDERNTLEQQVRAASGQVDHLLERVRQVEAERDEMAAAGRTVVECADEMRAEWAETEARLLARVAELEEAARWRSGDETPPFNTFVEAEVRYVGRTLLTFENGEWLPWGGRAFRKRSILGWRPLGPGPELAVVHDAPPSTCLLPWGGPFIDDGAADEALDGVRCGPESATDVQAQVLHGGLDVWCAPGPK